MSEPIKVNDIIEFIKSDVNGVDVGHRFKVLGHKFIGGDSGNELVYVCKSLRDSNNFVVYNLYYKFIKKIKRGRNLPDWF